jgi:hypothetical protein
VAALTGAATSSLFAGVYNWAWFVGFALSAGLYLMGMRAAGPAASEAGGAT